MATKIQKPYYPEIEIAAENIADTVAFLVNQSANQLESEMPYKAQAILENLIQILQAKV